uniref:protein moonraker-like isoform X2 n=1 Tax=Myxine glutinosa TaxID=7769 RepID=UPI00358F3F8C
MQFGARHGCDGGWRVVEPQDEWHGNKVQLKFSIDAPSATTSTFLPPKPIIIEKLGTCRRTNMMASSTSPRPCLSGFSVLSMEHLEEAALLAQRDLRHQRLEAHCNKYRSDLKAETINISFDEPQANQKVHLDEKQVVTRSAGFQVNRKWIGLIHSASLPSLDPGSGKSSVESNTVLEMRRLQMVLLEYVQQVEELVHCDMTKDSSLDPREVQRRCVQKREAAARGARVLYMLQQQIREIQEEINNLGPQAIKPTKKSRAKIRLSAVHRGAVRALRMFSRQVSDGGVRTGFPPQSRELGELIRQLSMCSARLEPDQHVVASIMAEIEELSKVLEQLDEVLKQKTFALSRKDLRKRQQKTPTTHRVTTSRLRETPASDHDIPHRLGSNLEKDVVSLEATELQCGTFQSDSRTLIKRAVRFQPLATGTVTRPAPEEGSKYFNASSRKQAICVERAPPVCNASYDSTKSNNIAERSESGPPAKWMEFADTVFQTRLEPFLQKAQQIAETLDAVCKRQESSSRPSSSSEIDLKVKWSLELLVEVVLEDLLTESIEDELRLRTEMFGFETPLPQQRLSLDKMLQRLNDMEREQNDIRRKWAEVKYADVVSPIGHSLTEEFVTVSSKQVTTSPQPLLITSNHELPLAIPPSIPHSRAELEDGITFEPSNPAYISRNTDGFSNVVILSVPPTELQNMRNYRQRFMHHLRQINHDAVGDFDPWNIAESLSEDLLTEAVEAVAQEVSKVCEDCAENMFLGEFAQHKHQS